MNTVWVEVNQTGPGIKKIRNVINSDFVERVAEKEKGCYLEMNSGFTVEIEEDLDYWLTHVKI